MIVPKSCGIQLLFGRDPRCRQYSWVDKNDGVDYSCAECDLKYECIGGPG